MGVCLSFELLCPWLSPFVLTGNPISMFSAINSCHSTIELGYILPSSLQGQRACLQLSDHSQSLVIFFFRVPKSYKKQSELGFSLLKLIVLSLQVSHPTSIGHKLPLCATKGTHGPPTFSVLSTETVLEP